MTKCSLRHAMRKIMGEKKSYLHYYKRIIRDFERGKWYYDIRPLVKKGYILIPCSYHYSKSGYRKIFCQVVVDFQEFEKQFEEYLNKHVYPTQIINSKIAVSRKIWTSFFGMFTKGNQYCQQAGYDCAICYNKIACDIAKEYTNGDPLVKQITKAFEMLYGDLISGYYSKFVIE